MIALADDQVNEPAMGESASAHICNCRHGSSSCSARNSPGIPGEANVVIGHAHTGLEELAPRHGLPYEVVVFGEILLDAVHHEHREIADVDVLRQVGGPTRRDHLAAPVGTHGPVGKAVRVVARPDDQARPYLRDTTRHRSFRRQLAIGLQEAIVRPDIFGGWILESSARPVLGAEFVAFEPVVVLADR